MYTHTHFIILKMRGRPQSKTFIVPQNEVLPAPALFNVELTMVQLGVETRTIETTYQWCARHRLIMNSSHCGTCNVDMSLTKLTRCNDGYRWHCRGCGKYTSVRAGSFFQRSHLPIAKLIIFIYGWVKDRPLHDIIDEAQFTRKSGVDWANFCRDICAQWLEQNPIEIGGMDDQNNPIVAKIDESKFFQRKYHRGYPRGGDH